MIQQEIQPGIVLRCLEKQHAKQFFDFIEKGRLHFIEWIPFVSKTTSLDLAEQKIVDLLDMFKNGNGYFWCIWKDNTIIGFILIKDVDSQTKSAEIGYMIDKDFEGKGLISHSCILMIDFIFNILGFNKIVLCCDDNNERSINVAKKFGFNIEGILKDCIVINGKIRNTMHWALFRKEYLEEDK